MIANDLKCPDCGTVMTYRATSPYGRPWYACPRYPACNGAHGAHPDGTPLGVPADKTTRAARVRAHEMFDRLWKNAPSNRKKRKRVKWYAMLREHMQLTREQCHIGSMTREQCAIVEAFALTHLNERAAARGDKPVVE
jgi:ssDNA-binding Zn-finger/Zn-ribbon topoisomerase 1